MRRPLDRHVDPRLERSMLWCSILGVLAYGVSDENPAILILGLALVIGAWRIARARGVKPLGLMMSTACTIGAVGYALARMSVEGFVVDVFSEFVLILLAIKLVDRRSSRDDAQALLLSLFLVIGAILTSNRLWLGMILMVYVPVLASAVLRHQIQSAKESTREPRAWRAPARARARVAGYASAASLACLLVSVGIFLIMPRGVGARAFGSWGGASVGSVTSFTDSVELGRGGLISQSPTPVLDLEVFDGDWTPFGSTAQVFHLRGAVLDTYEQGSWRASPPRNELDRIPMDAPPGTGVSMVTGLVGNDSQIADHILKVTLRNSGRRETHLFSIWRPLKVSFDRHERYRVDKNIGVIIRYGQPGKVQYTAFCRAVSHDSDDTTPERQAPYPTFPSEPIEALASSLLEGLASPISPDPATRSVRGDALAAAVFRDYLQTGFEYTLETLAAPPGLDPTEWFLFESRLGHCEYYASAMAAMCRSVGINARVVTGYIASEWNGATSHYIVRESNAHAWVEVEIRPGLWRTFDPTPPADFQRIHEPSDSLFAQARQLIDSLEYAWISTVIGYDENSGLSGISRRIGDALSSLSTRLVGRVRAEGIGALTRPVGAGLIAFSITIVIGTLLNNPVLMAWFRGVLGSPLAWLAARFGSGLPAVLRPRSLGRDLDRAMVRAGSPRPLSTPMLQHINALPDPGISDPARRAATAIYDDRFGGRPMTPESRGLIARAIRGIATRAGASENRGASGKAAPSDRA